MSNFFDNIKDKGNKVKDNILDKFGLLRTDWPQKIAQPPFGVTGFLPPQLISPRLKLQKKKSTGGKDDDEEKIDPEEKAEERKNSDYVYTDWLGYKITENPKYKEFTSLDTKDRFEKSKDLPKLKTELEKDPYSNRDVLLLFNDATQDYFKYSLQTVYGLNNDFPTYTPLKRGEGSTARLYNYMNNVGGTPYENNDPIQFGFEIIIDAVSSTLLDDSIMDFLDSYSQNVSELKARYEVYQDFKNQFKKLFKTKGNIRVDESKTQITNLGANPATVEDKDNLYKPGKRAYMAYFLKKVEGLSNLIEKNTPSKPKFLVDYGTDLIKLEFYEDVSLSLGTLAHLYKLLYWSKPNGKGMIPENLLRFNCEIIVSEIRNYNRTRKAMDTGRLEIIKDNVSRYIYSLRECQFYFDAYTHPDGVDNSNLTTTESYNISFDYKYSSVKLERWMPGASSFGTYVGYNSGAMWKIGNSTTRGASYSISIPQFLTMGQNQFFQNGVKKPVVINTNFKVLGKMDEIPNNQDPSLPDDSLGDKAVRQMKNFAKRSLDKAKNLGKQAGNRLIAAALREGQSAINTQFALLNQSINKILQEKLGIERLGPPKNIYTSETISLEGRLFYDVRSEVANFVGGMLGNQILTRGSNGTIVIPPRVPTPNPLVETNIASQRNSGFTNGGGDTVRYNQSAQQNYGTSNFRIIQFPFYAQRFPAPTTTRRYRP